MISNCLLVFCCCYRLDMLFFFFVGDLGLSKGFHYYLDL